MSNARFILQVHVGTFSTFYEALSIEASKQTISDEIVSCVVEKLGLKYPQNYELAEVVYDANGQDCKERRLGGTESPVALQLLWPRSTSLVECDREFQAPQYRFCLRQKFSDSARHGLLWPDSTDHKLIQEYFLRFLYQPRDKEYTDLCQLPNLTEQTLLENLKVRFEKGHIYTYVGSILIAVNPFRFYPIYNPKYVKLYQNHQLGDLPPHIFAIADAGYQLMLRQRKNQCIVISGESGSGKTESTHLLLHHLTALSQKGTHGSGVEQTILSASPVLEAFGNAKTKHNNNSSRFGKFIQVNYKENGQVHGALVQKYLLEKSRIISQSKNERNYHVFYYMLEGANDTERTLFHLHQSKDYYYLNQSDCFKVEGVDEAYEFNRLKQSMEMVGFTPDKQKGLLGILSAVLHLGNVEFSKKSNYYSDEIVVINNPATVSIISHLLGVKEETLNSALTCKHVKTRGETLIFHYKMPEAIATRDAMAKCLYSALFDWIVMQVNHALLSKQDAREHKGNSIGVLDIFGFEDFGSHNSFEQFCINFANEHLQYYFNQHVFKYEQEEYEREGIQWKNIEFKDNTGCLELIEGRPHGLLCLLDDQCSFPGATDATLQQKFENYYRNNEFYELPQCKENSFFVKHYAGKVKYQLKEFREKNLELMRPYFVMLLKSSCFTLVRELVGADPVAVFRWAILRALFRAHFAFMKVRQSAAEPKNSKMNKMKENCLRQNRRNSSSNSTRNPLSIVQTSALQSPNKACNKEYGICSLHSLEAVLCASEAKVLERANQIMLKSKSVKKTKHEKTLNNLKTMKALMGKTHYCGHRTAKKQSPTVSAQFQTSLNQLMETLNQANPFFVRCIKSNIEKIPNCFDDAMILRQLRYTGMLETVRIRQSGYSVRLTFEEFIQRYRILLPKGLLSSQLDISNFLSNMPLNQDNYQMGKTKVFFRENEKLKLDECLHQTILRHIVILQRWVRTWLIRRRFKRMRIAAIVIQTNIRRYIAQQKLIHMKMQILAAICIQRIWRGYHMRTWYRKLKKGCIVVQAACRGYLKRKKYLYLWENHHKQRTSLQENGQKAIIVCPRRALSTSLLEESNQFNWNVKSLITKKPEVLFQRQQSKDSDGSSGIHEDSEPESLASESTGSVLHSPPPSPLVEGPSSLPASNIKQNKRHRKESLHRHCVAASVINIDKPFKKELSYKDKSNQLNSRMQTITLNLNSENKRQNDLEQKDSETFIHTKGPLHKARKHLKTFIGRNKKTASLDESEDSGPDDVNLYVDGNTENLANISILPSKKINCNDNRYRHRMKTVTSFHKGEFCTGCEKSMALLFTHGYKCTRCKLLFHSKCISKSSHISCENFNRVRRTPSKLHKNNKAEQLPITSWNVTRTSEFRDPRDIIVTDVSELQNMDDFIFKKLCQMSGNKEQKDCLVDVVFKRSLREFKFNLISTYSVAAAQDGRLCICYKDLIDNFEQVMQSVCYQENTSQTFPVIMGVNAFRGFLDEFRNLYRNEEKVKSKGKKRKRKKTELAEYLGHKFMAVVINIPTACEICSSFMWLMEKGLVCQGCKLTCHKKCYTKVNIYCKNCLTQHEKRVFGAPLDYLVSSEIRIPVVVERLITMIELKGLYIEGIYRKSGIASKVRKLKDLMEEDPSSVDLDSFPVHVLTTVLKSFFREMPEPLMTYELYDDFIRACELSDFMERIQTIYIHLHKLPMANFDVLERLVFHLARVAQQEEYNRMSVNALAIIFAPCILRTNKKLRVQDTLEDVGKQTLCIETILKKQLYQVRTTLQDIDTLDAACHTATSRLSSLRSSKIFLLQENDNKISNVENFEEEILTQHIENMQNEKVLLTTVLPSLWHTQEGSDDDLLSTDMDSNTGSVDDICSNQYSDTMSSGDPPASLQPNNLKHLTKNRVLVPKRRLPSRFVHNSSQQEKNKMDESVVSFFHPQDVDQEDAIIV